ncbi:aspartate kinase [Brevibacterium sp. 50QC2O2]|jgi:aspartate kinase|uniref:aspartate kinase n=1 Tax=unclassified Brevibacterium TaxID=2614124 RepID=UPI00211CB1A9|nr:MULTISPECIES: aspartate kinase [unclassified Brevibacterium]MCQ9368592.1 aspartate kinase [Brevibacterium sp. 91QC2O2]MCQ9387199.1 aspartate kinase [Brevibacterium sp. 50QC2O2]
MSLVVQKFGGSSVADAASIKRVAQRIVEYRKAGHEVVVVVSAMGDTTDDLIDLAQQVSPMPPARELDMLLTAGERISMAVLAMAIANLGFNAKSFTGSQAGMITDESFGRARIIDVTPGRIRSALDTGNIAIVAGFQGVSQTTKNITTLGRGGSDTTAVALAAALNADVCEIYTDVDGVFTADPRIVPAASRIETITFEEMLEMAASGAKVLHLRAVEYARRYNVPIHCRSSFSHNQGTWVTDDPIPAEFRPRRKPGALTPEGTDTEETDTTMEQAIISGVAHDRSEAKLTIVGVPDIPGKAAQIFTIMAKTEINIDMIVQNISTRDPGRTDISFTLPASDGAKATRALEDAKSEIGFDHMRYDDQIGKLSVIGAGMRSHPGVTAKLFEALSDAHINIDMISTSEIRISVVTRADLLDEAVRVAHSAYGLDAEEVEAIVYGGTGR